MNQTQHLSRATSDTCGNLRRLGCKILAATAINDHGWIKATRPERLSPQARIRLHAIAWTSPAIIEWSVK